MVSINTNLSSLMVQSNLTQATNGLNKAIERLSTGYKINHASDNAANYSIANTYESKLSSYEVAASNVQSGLDLLSVAQDTISTMQDHGSRLQALITQARNGTYGAQSLNAMTQEASAIISEINKMYTNTEYNGINLFDNFKLPDWAAEIKETAGIEEDATVGLTNDIKPNTNGFIANIVNVTPDIIVENADALTGAIEDNDIIGIANATVLAKLAILVNSGTNCEGKVIVLTDDIDLSDYQTGTGWTAIGTTAKQFLGTFDGQGHKIKGLKICKPSVADQGLFGFIGSNSTVKNVSIEKCDVQGENRTAGLVGYAYTYSIISNCYVTGNIEGTTNTGGLVGYASANASVATSYVNANVTGTDKTGGLMGRANCRVTDSFASGRVEGTANVGGLIGYTSPEATISNDYATSDVFGISNVGGLIGYTYCAITNTYASGKVLATEENVGGLLGFAYSKVNNSYATGSVSGNTAAGGLIGKANGIVNNTYATGMVTGTANYVGGLIGSAIENITNSYSTGFIKGESYVGGLAGRTEKVVKNCYSAGDVVGVNNRIGGLVGLAVRNIQKSYSTGNVKGYGNTGGLVGESQTNARITESFATGDVSGRNWLGGLVGRINKVSGTGNYDKLFASGKVNGVGKFGSLIGGVVNTTDGTSFSTISITNASVVNQDSDIIAFEGTSSADAYESGQMSSWLENIKVIKSPETILQVGIMGDKSSRTSFDTGFKYDLNSILSDIKSDKAYNAINKFMSTLSAKATDLGSVSNRLESSLESIAVNMQNLGDSLSTVKDVDMAEVSSEYIKKQILQQASATLLATANQSPAIALQLI